MNIMLMRTFNICGLKNMYICQDGQLKSKRINSPMRPFVTYFSCRDPSSTADVKPSMKVMLVFNFVCRLLRLNLHPKIDYISPLKSMKKMLMKS